MTRPTPTALGRLSNRELRDRPPSKAVVAVAEPVPDYACRGREHIVAVLLFDGQRSAGSLDPPMARSGRCVSVGGVVPWARAKRSAQTVTVTFQGRRTVA